MIFFPIYGESLLCAVCLFVCFIKAPTFRQIVKLMIFKSSDLQKLERVATKPEFSRTVSIRRWLGEFDRAIY